MPTPYRAGEPRGDRQPCGNRSCSPCRRPPGGPRIAGL